MRERKNVLLWSCQTVKRVGVLKKLQDMWRRSLDPSDCEKRREAQI